LDGGMMRRRKVVALLGAAALWPRTVRAQELDFRVIGFLAETPADQMRARMAAFRRGLAEIGYAEKRNVAFDWRVATDAGELKKQAADLAGYRVALIVAVGDGAAQAARDATVPVVFISGSDPGMIGERGRNITGVSWFGPDLAPARLGLLRHIVPKATVAGFLADANLGNARETVAAMETAATQTMLRLVTARVRSAGEFETAFATLAAQHAGGLVVGASEAFTTGRAQLIELSRRRNIPTIYAAREFADDGGLASYGQSVADAFRRAGIYAAWILKGAQPAELPILPSAKFELVFNLKSAAGFGLEVPPNLLATADEIIR
jgi:putative ABC transport system substrate-binding protein